MAEQENLKSCTQESAAHQQHLQFIQDVITRMNTNSFSMKGWMITIVSAFMALYVDKGNAWLLILPIVPTILFWFLDAYYLWMERTYRCLYKDAIMGNIELYDMDTSRYNVCFCKVLFSKTICTIYITILALILILIVAKGSSYHCICLS